MRNLFLSSIVLASFGVLAQSAPTPDRNTDNFNAVPAFGPRVVDLNSAGRDGGNGATTQNIAQGNDFVPGGTGNRTTGNRGTGDEGTGNLGTGTTRTGNATTGNAGTVSTTTGDRRNNEPGAFDTRDPGTLNRGSTTAAPNTGAGGSTGANAARTATTPGPQPIAAPQPVPTAR